MPVRKKTSVINPRKNKSTNKVMRRLNNMNRLVREGGHPVVLDGLLPTSVSDWLGVAKSPEGAFIIAKREYASLRIQSSPVVTFIGDHVQPHYLAK
jgi:hypothetical protein